MKKFGGNRSKFNFGLGVEMKKPKIPNPPKREIENDESDDKDESLDNFFFSMSHHHENVYTDENRIYFKDSVNEATINSLIKIINNKNKELRKMHENPLVNSIEPNPLYLHITSYGGCVFSALRAIDAIRNSKIPIYTVIDGHAASAGTLMSVVGQKRYMTPNSQVLIHQLSTGFRGKYFELQDEFENCTKLMNHIYKIYVDHTNMKLKDLKSQLKHDIWWTADDCLKYGLVDEVMDFNNV